MFKKYKINKLYFLTHLLLVVRSAPDATNTPLTIKYIRAYELLISSKSKSVNQKEEFIVFVTF